MPRNITHFLLYINDLPDDVACDVAIYADDIHCIKYRNFI